MFGSRDISPWDSSKLLRCPSVLVAKVLLRLPPRVVQSRMGFGRLCLHYTAAPQPRVACSLVSVTSFLNGTSSIQQNSEDWAAQRIAAATF